MDPLGWLALPDEVANAFTAEAVRVMDARANAGA